MAYTDVLHIYGMSRAGYVPQMSTFRISTPVAIFELLKKTGACAYVYEPSFDLDLSGCPVPAYPAVHVSEQDVAHIVLPPLQTDHSASDLIFILHTSGSTGDSPTPVSCNRRWLDSIVTRIKGTTPARPAPDQVVTIAM